MPGFSHENRFPLGAMGVDEAGRGPLAGPVVAGATWLDRATLPEGLCNGLDDSKKLSPRKREALYGALIDCPAVRWGVGLASVEEIDCLNILRATHLAMRRAAERLVGSSLWPEVALIDGNSPPGMFPCPTVCIIKGDGVSLSIAAASVLAKVTRDRLMIDLDRQFPHYGWARNMGYGTAQHRAAILRHGRCEHHRNSFACQATLFSQNASGPEYL